MQAHPIFTALRDSPGNRSTNLQLSEFGNGTVRLTGFLQLSAVSLVGIAAKHGAVLRVTKHTSSPPTLVVDVLICSATPAADLGQVFKAPILKVVCESSTTHVYPLPSEMTSDAIERFLQLSSAIELILRPTTMYLEQTIQSTHCQLRSCA